MGDTIEEINIKIKGILYMINIVFLFIYNQNVVKKLNI